jgi:hypothetical protein
MKNGAQFETAHRIHAPVEPNTTSDVNNLFKHTNRCEIKSQSIDIE